MEPPRTSEPPISPRRGLRALVVWLTAGLLVAYLATAYVIAPTYWKQYARRHPALGDVPGITHTAAGIPGDPVNVALIGTKTQLVQAMLAAKWVTADPLGFKSDLKIAEATVLKRPYADAPVSNLYLFGRKEDLAFEQPVGNNPRERHHVRFWQTDKADPDGRPVWVGAATFDKGVGLSHRTGQVTHHTAADVDAERDYLFRDLEGAGALVETYAEADYHTERSGRNGGGDPWTTDGKLYVGVINPDSAP